MQILKKRLYRKILSLFFSMMVLVVLLMIVGIYQSVVHFADSGLEAAIRDKIDKPDGLILRTDLLQITHFDAPGRNIARLDGIEHLRRLVFLNLEHNRVEDLTPLRHLDKLTELNIRNNGILDLDSLNLRALSGLPLRRLSLRNNAAIMDDGAVIRLSDLSQMKYLTSLEYIDLRGNDIVDITPLSMMGKLRELDLRENRISDISPLKNLNSLRELNLRENLITDLSPLSALNDLTYMNIHSNTGIESLAPLATLSRLQTLIMPNVPLGNQISVLRNLTELTRLNVRNCAINDLTVIANLIADGSFNITKDKRVIETSIDIRDNPIDLAVMEGDAVNCEYWIHLSNRLNFHVPDFCQLEPPGFSHSGGFYTSPFELNLSHPDPEVVIIYTLDGSEPDINNLNGTTYIYKNQFPRDPDDPIGEKLHNKYQSHIYTNPISIYDRSPEPDKLSQISSTNHAKPKYFPATPVRKGTVVQARAFKAGVISSKPVGHTYFVWQKGNPYDLPVISLQIQENLLFGYNEGVYTAGVDWDTWRINNPEREPHGAGRPSNFSRRGGLWEHPARLEIFENNNQQALVNQGIGFRVHGAWSRALPVKNLRLYARYRHDVLNEFQIDFFNENVTFATNPGNDLYKRIMLRGQGSGGPFIYDWVAHKLMQPVYEGMLRGKPVIHFINGEYWGLTALRDRFDEYHLAYHYDLDPDNIIITWAAGNKGSHTIDVGLPSDKELLNHMMNFIIDNDMSDEVYFRQVENMIDIRSYVDHLIPNIYLCNTHYERGFWRVREPSDAHFGDGRWRTYTQDFDQTLWDDNYLKIMANDVPMFRNLLENPGFQNYFINRFADHINTTFIPERMETILHEEYARIEPYLDEDFHRWDRNFAVDQFPYDTIASLRDFINYSYTHPSRQRRYIRDQFGIKSELNITLEVTNHRHGYIRINTIDIKDGTPGIDAMPYPWTGVYFSDIPVELEAFPQTGYYFAGWIVWENGIQKPLSSNKEFYSSESLISLNLSSNTSVKAVFKINSCYTD